MITTIVFLLLTMTAAIALTKIVIILIIRALRHMRRKTMQDRRLRIKGTLIVLVAVLTLNLILAAVSQMTAATPAIRDANGNIPENSIAELARVDLNGKKQWISIRGWDKTKPVLLFLAGGPGGSQLAAVRYELSELEKHFVVVGWDQPGAGKSYFARPVKSITAETYIQDGYALTEYLASRFGKEKIYLVGESWGSALGIFLIDRYPEAYHAFIGTGQMVDFTETEIMDYEKALAIARGKNDTAIISKLESNGRPPYYGDDVTWKSAVYLNYLSEYMMRDPAIQNSGYNTLRDIFAVEYGMLDKINYARGIINTFNHVYQQLYAIDLRKDFAELDVPVYFFLGRHDINAPAVLVEEYFQALDCPAKEIVWFERSGHNPWINENGKFTGELLARFNVHITDGGGENND